MTPIIRTLILYTSVQNLAQNVATNTESAGRNSVPPLCTTQTKLNNFTQNSPNTVR